MYLNPDAKSCFRYQEVKFKVERSLDVSAHILWTTHAQARKKPLPHERQWSLVYIARAMRKRAGVLQPQHCHIDDDVAVSFRPHRMRSAVGLIEVYTYIPVLELVLVPVLVLY
jgi:hypothetical protein